jgi:pyruvate,water dikinase
MTNTAVSAESQIVAPAADGGLDEGAVGGKAAGLDLLLRTGARVPPFFVVPATAFRAHLRDPGVVGQVGESVLRLAELPAGLRGDPAALTGTYAELRAAIERTPLPRELRQAIEAAAGGLGPGPYAVRSSMVGEDSGEHSFAGQLRSELFQRTAGEIAESVRTCWSSALGTPALVYAARVGLAPVDARVAVVVQAMIDPDVAGVVFSADPVTGNREECLVSAAYGVGEGVVAGAAPADSYVWSAAGGELSATVVHKDTSVRASSSGRGTEICPVPAAARDQRALTRAQVAEVGALARSVADAAGRPMDVEWCFSRGVLYALQARPITSLPPDRSGAGARRLFDNSNIQESFNGVTTPLTFSFAAGLYSTVYASLLRSLGASEHTLKGFEPAGRSLLALIDGRVYYNLGSWRQLIEILPRGRQRVQEIETIMFRTTIGASEPLTLALPDRVRRAAEATRMAVRLVRFLVRQDAEVDRYIEGFERFYGSIDRAQLATKTLDELGVLLRRFEGEAVRPAARAYLNDVRMAIASGRLRRLLGRVYDEGQADARLTELLGGIDGLESVEPTRQLIGIARDVRRDEALAADVRAAPPGDVISLIHGRSPDLAARIDAYVERYGDRAIGELKLETLSLRDDPRLLGEVIGNYLGRPDVDPDGVLRTERERSEAALRALGERVPVWRRRLLAREVRMARTAVSCRERLRLRRTWMFALARDVYRAIGGQLQASGQIESPRDIFYLSTQEIDAFLDGRAASARLGPLIAARKVEYDGYRRMPTQDRMQTAGTPYLGYREELAADDAGPPATGHPDDGLLRGLGCCAGIVEAPVRIILDPSESLSVNGQILCTVRTDPGWAPLFPTASGLLIERGSILSHSAVVARELGIPTVVGVPGVTRLLTDGERLRLDGGTGVVERLGSGEGS